MKCSVCGGLCLNGRCLMCGRETICVTFKEPNDLAYLKQLAHHNTTDAGGMRHDYPLAAPSPEMRDTVKTDEKGMPLYRCNKCGAAVVSSKAKFCRSCGQKERRKAEKCV